MYKFRENILESSRNVSETTPHLYFIVNALFADDLVMPEVGATIGTVLIQFALNILLPTAEG